MSGALALDLGTKTGFAVRVSGRLVLGTEDFAARRGDSPGIRYLRFARWLRETIQASGVRLVVYEKVMRHLGTDAAHVYGGFEAHLQAFCAEQGVDHMAISVQTIKKFALGKANAKKAQMIDWALGQAAELGVPGQIDDNAADALALLLYTEKHEL